MTEILTESFCERCGTRYTFESAAPRRSRLGRVRTVSKGLRNFVLSDESSLSEAMADARSDEERSATTSQLDAFHRTFNFCLTCRQYTCGNCWNTAEGRCLTCMPLPGMEPGADLIAVQPIAFVEPTNGFHDHEDVPDAIGPEAWPEADLGVERLGRVMGAAVVADEADVDELPAAEDAYAEAAGDTASEPAPLFEADGGDAAVTLEAEAPLELDEDAVAARIAGVAPGQSVEEALAAYEAQVAAEEAERAHQEELVVIAAAALADEPEPSHAAAEAEVEPVVAEVEPGAAEAGAEPVAEVEAVGEVGAEPDLVAAGAEPVGEVGAEPDLVAAGAEPVADAEPVAEVEAEPDLVAAGAEPVAEVAAEPELAAAGAELDADRDAIAAAAALAAIAAPEEGIEPQPEPLAAEPEPDHHGLAAAAAAAGVAAIAAPDLPASVTPREDVVAQPTWPVTPAAAPPPPPSVTPVPDPVHADQPAQPVENPWLTVAPDEGNQPQWPAAPIWGQPNNGGRPAPATLAGRPLLPQDDAASLWAASAREVLQGTAKAPQPVAAPNLTPQPCVSCGLSLSANARFCRRCGTRQG